MTAWDENRAAFAAAARWFVAITATIDTEWERPALGDWTVRDLVGHTSRALLTVETYLGADADAAGGAASGAAGGAARGAAGGAASDPPAGPPGGEVPPKAPAVSATMGSPVAYYRLAMAALGEPSAVAARGHDAGKALGPDPIGTVAAIAARVLARIDQAAPEDLVATPVGGIRLADYLPTRTFELTVHSCDLAAALGVPASVPDAAASAGLHLLADLAADKGLAAAVLLAATGRGPLPPGFTVL